MSDRTVSSGAVLESRTALDLAIRGGTVVTADASYPADIGIRAGKIVQLGAVDPAMREIDARGKLVLPGGIDMHVHLTPGEMPDGTYRHADDFGSGSAAAALGGITTVGNMTFARQGERLPEALARVTAEASDLSLVDFVLHPVVMFPDEGTEADPATLAVGGHTSVKLFMNVPVFDQHAGRFLAVLRCAADEGMLAMVHCEDHAIIEFSTREIINQGGAIAHYPDSRPPQSEWAAVARALAMAQTARAPLYVVHLGSAAALDLCRLALANGHSVFVETRPLYLHFDEAQFSGPDAPLFVGNPPLRSAADRDALWSGLRAGHIHTVCSDHAPWTREEKLQAATSLANARPGMSELDTLMPVLFAEGVQTGRISLQRFVAVTATNAAKLFGLFPQKGTVAIGSDADLVIWDPDLRRVIRAEESPSRAGFSLYEGRETRGWPTHTIRRGEVIAEYGRIVANSSGASRAKLVPRSRWAGFP